MVIQLVDVWNLKVKKTLAYYRETARARKFQVVMETSVSIIVRWKAGYDGGYEPQTFRLEYKESTESGKLIVICWEISPQTCIHASSPLDS